MHLNESHRLLLLEALRRRSSEITIDGHHHGIIYAADESGEFASIGWNLPEGIYAEIEDGEYGELQALRIYLDN